MIQKQTKSTLPYCPLCLQADPTAQAICPTCHQHMPWREDHFQSLTKQINLYIPLHYEGCIQTLIQRFKFHHDFLAGRLLAFLFTHAKHPPPTRPELLIPVPLHWWRLFRRGFNQAGLLAQDIQKEMYIPVTHRLCRRARWTKPQTHLSAQQRKRNMQHTFSTKTTVTQQHVAIIDDVYTTGHTTQALAQCLLNAGATRVSIWCVARAG